MSVIVRDVAERGLTAGGAAYRIVWRWHFYAGLFCLPFVAILSLSGAIYLFKPQIDAFADRAFDHLQMAGPLASLDEQVAAALASAPDARLKALLLRRDPTDAARVLLMRPDGQELRVFVRPDTLQIADSQLERSRFTSIVHDLHGELLAGEPGALLVELAGAWAIVMVITGLYLWWPRADLGLGGVLYPRLGGGRRFLRDLHAVTGVWLSFLALFFLISALPWTKVWGQGFKTIRSFAAAEQVRQDWTTGPASEQALRLQEYRDAKPSNAEAPEDEHAGHHGQSADHSEHAEHMKHAGALSGQDGARIEGFERIAALARPLQLADPVLVSPPSPNKRNWVVRSNSQNRPSRVTLEYDPATFALVKRETFDDRPLIDRIVGVGVAAHEGQLFGWVNQLLGLVTAVGYLTLVVTSALMWWRRRPQGRLGAPPALAQTPRLAPFVIALVVAIGVFLPTLGISLILIAVVERIIRRWAPETSAWLGLASST